MSAIIPTLRIYDYDKTIEFYVDWLGFIIEWTHTFEPGAPRFMRASLGDVVLHLSEHHGDCSPGARITVVDFKGLKEYHAQLIAKKYKYNRPGLEIPFWDPESIMVTVIDPVGNRIIFIEKVK
jgi:catechol 2,3-dioxygenase-like lactoylglutathione lyase family enzyme